MDGMGGGYDYIHDDREDENDTIGCLYLLLFVILPFLAMAYQNIWGGGW